MDGLVDKIASWQALLWFVVVCAVLGAAPGLVVGLIVRLYPRNAQERRQALVGDLADPRRNHIDRFIFMFTAAEVAIREAVPMRLGSVVHWFTKTYPPGGYFISIRISHVGPNGVKSVGEQPYPIVRTLGQRAVKPETVCSSRVLRRLSSSFFPPHVQFRLVDADHECRITERKRAYFDVECELWPEAIRLCWCEP